MVSATFEINTTRDIARQILRHRSFSFQEFSQRYADASQLGFEVSEARMQDHKNRQNSILAEDINVTAWWERTQDIVIENIRELYKDALDKGIAKEQARKLLPEGLTMSRLYMSGSIRSWIHYCELRSANGTQKEHQLIAQNIWKQLLDAVPELNEVLNKE
jgi:thymidylate synthase (FAD)